MQMTSEELKAAEIRSHLKIIDLMVEQVKASAARIDVMLAELEAMKQVPA